MATIDSNGVLFYQDSDNFTPPASLNLAQSNLSSLIGNNTRFRRVANITARNALVASIGTANITPDNPLLVWRADAAAGLQLEYTTNGTIWRQYADKQYYDARIVGDATLTMSNGFLGAVGGGWIGMTIRAEGALVIINGLFTRATPWGVGETIGTVPSGWAPPRREKGNGADVLAGGTVVADAAGAANALVSCKVAYFRP